MLLHKLAAIAPSIKALRVLLLVVALYFLASKLPPKAGALLTPKKHKYSSVNKVCFKKFKSHSNLSGFFIAELGNTLSSSFFSTEMIA